MNNRWITHVKQYQLKHSCSYKDAMKLAKNSYNAQSGSGAVISSLPEQDVHYLPPPNLTQAQKNRLVKKYMKEIREYKNLIKNNPRDEYTTEWKLYKSNREYQVRVLLNPELASVNQPLILPWN